jgi:GTPase SAR1 family protein
MPIRYIEAFGLSDNPFGPRLQWRQVSPPLTVSLEKRPLLVHKDARLDALYCEKIPSFKSAFDKLKAVLDASGYTVDPPVRGVAPFLVAIEGDRGTGKTTLASRLLQGMLKRTPPGEPDWHVEELMLKSITQTASDQATLLKALEKKVIDTNAPYNCVLVDDVLADAYPAVTQVYDNLLEKCVVFMVFTSYDQKMAEQIEKSLHNVQRHAIAPLTPDDAIAFVSARYDVFRVAPAAAAVGAPPLFPFDEHDIRTAVTVKTFSGTSATGPVNLRLLASILEAALSSRLQEIATNSPTFNVQNVAADQLQQLTIKVAQSYSSVVRK